MNVQFDMHTCTTGNRVCHLSVVVFLLLFFVFLKISTTQCYTREGVTWKTPFRRIYDLPISGHTHISPQIKHLTQVIITERLIKGTSGQTTHSEKYTGEKAKKSKVGRSVKNLDYFFVQKCVFYA